jgi:hypothetical protein
MVENILSKLSSEAGGIDITEKLLENRADITFLPPSGGAVTQARVTSTMDFQNRSGISKKPWYVPIYLNNSIGC